MGSWARVLPAPGHTLAAEFGSGTWVPGDRRGKGASSPGALSLALVEQLTASDQLTGSGCEGTAPLPPGNTAVPRVLPRFRRNGEEGGRQLRQPWCKPLPVLSSCPAPPCPAKPRASKSTSLLLLLQKQQSLELEEKATGENWSHTNPRTMR